MAGSGKGKKKKNKGKSNNNVPKSNNKQQGISSPKLDPGLQHIKNSGASEEYAMEMLLEKINILEDILVEKIELLYRKAEEKLLGLGYGIDEARRAILMNGSVFGGEHILSNIFSNALAVINKGQVTSGQIGIEPVFENVHELAKFSMQTLINMIVQDQPTMEKLDAILYLLQSNALEVQASSVDCSHSEDDEDQGDKTASEIDIGKMLMENSACLQRLSISPNYLLPSPSLIQNVATKVSKLQIHDPHVTTGESSSSQFESSVLDFLKCFINCPDEISVEDWISTCSEDSKALINMKLSEEIETLTTLVRQRREWATNKVIQTANRFSAVRSELRDLRLEKSETDRLLEQKEEFLNFSSVLREKENHLMRVKRCLDNLNHVRRRLEAQNSGIKADIVAYDLATAETEKSILEAQKRERLNLKKSNDTEKKVGDLKRQIAEEKQKIAEMAQKMQQVIDAQEKAKLRLRQEKEAKAQAHAQLLEEKRLYRLAKENSERRLASVKQELDLNYRLVMDDKNRLEQELSQLKAAQASSTTSSSGAVSSSIQSRRGPSRRPCIICKRNDVCILFLPCAHQVICSDCHEEVFEVFEYHCPRCKAPIEKRVKTYGPSA